MPSRLTKTWLRRNSYYGILLILSVLMVLFFPIWLHLPLQAQDAQSQMVATNWNYAVFPVENFQSYTSLYGYRIHPMSGKRQFHYGLDMAAPLGSYVRNWWAGVVVKLSDHTGCGTMITIQSGPWKHNYCHLSGHVESTPQGTFLVDRSGGIIIAEGQQLPAGVRMARVGMTGTTNGSHLHWELMYQGNHVDPALILQQMYGNHQG